MHARVPGGPGLRENSTSHPFGGGALRCRSTVVNPFDTGSSLLRAPFCARTVGHPPGGPHSGGAGWVPPPGTPFLARAFPYSPPICKHTRRGLDLSRSRLLRPRTIVGGFRGPGPLSVDPPQGCRPWGSLGSPVGRSTGSGVQAPMPHLTRSVIAHW